MNAVVYPPTTRVQIRRDKTGTAANSLNPGEMALDYLNRRFNVGVDTTVSLNGILSFESFDQSLNKSNAVTFAKLGIGMVPVEMLDITANGNLVSAVHLLNNSPGNGARGEFSLSNGSFVGGMTLYGTDYDPGGMSRQSGLNVYANGPGGLTLNSMAAAPIYFGYENVERMRLVGHGANGGELRISGVSGSECSQLSLLSSGYWTWGVRGDSDAVKFFADNTELLRITPNSKIGINNPAPTYIVDAVQHQNGLSAYTIANGDMGASARMGYLLSSATWSAQLILTGPGYSASTPYDLEQCLYLATNAAQGINIVSTYTGPIRFFTGQPATERVRIQQDTGNLIGFSSVGVSSLYPNISMTGCMSPYHINNDYGGLIFKTLYNDVLYERVRITYDGYVGINQTNPQYLLDARWGSNSGGGISVSNGDTGGSAYCFYRAGNGPSTLTMGMSGINYVQSSTYDKQDGAWFSCNGVGGFTFDTVSGGGPINFHVGYGMRGQFSKQGYFKATADGSLTYPNGPTHEIFQNSPTGWDALTLSVRGSEPYGQFWRFRESDPNDSARYYFRCYSDATGIDRLRLWSNGGIYNWQANNGNYSDASIKTDITRYDELTLNALEAGFKNVDWCRFKYTGQTHDDWNFGYTAQGVAEAFATIAPELVDETDWSVRDEIIGQKVKVVFQTDLDNIAHALLARALARIDALEQRAVA